MLEGISVFMSKRSENVLISRIVVVKQSFYIDIACGIILVFVLVRQSLRIETYTTNYSINLVSCFRSSLALLSQLLG